MYISLSTFSHLFIKTFQNCGKPGPVQRTRGRIAIMLLASKHDQKLNKKNDKANALDLNKKNAVALNKQNAKANVLELNKKNAKAYALDLNNKNWTGFLQSCILYYFIDFLLNFIFLFFKFQENIDDKNPVFYWYTFFKSFSGGFYRPI